MVVLGSTGQLGSDLLEAFASYEVHGLSHEDLDIRNADRARQVLGNLSPHVVVNAAAFHNVPRCESMPVEAFAINSIAPRELASICAEIDARLVHVSTDYVFDGGKRAPYLETDRPNPLNVYAISKLAGEYGVLNARGSHQVVRSSGLYGKRPCRAKGGNFIDTMFRLAREQAQVRVVDDEVLTPTFTADLAAQICVLSLEGAPGLYHATNSGSCSWYEFARVVFELGNLTTPLEPTTVEALAHPVRRPHYSVLDNTALRAAGLDRMRPWREALTAYMAWRTGGSS